MRSSLQQTSTLWILAKNGTNALDLCMDCFILGHSCPHQRCKKPRLGADRDACEMDLRRCFLRRGVEVYPRDRTWSRGVIEIGCWAFHWCFFDVFGMTMGVLHWNCGSGKWYVIDMCVLIGFCVKHKERRFSNNTVFLVSLITRT